MKLTPNKVCHCSNKKTKLLQVKIINKCTGNCWFCIDKGNYSPEEVNADKMIQAILSESDYNNVDITGGEPFIDFEVLLKVLKAIRPYKKQIILNTNGSLLTPEKASELNELIDLLKIGLQHYDEEKNADIIRTRVSFINLKESLKNRKFKVYFNMVITKAWENEKNTFVDKLVDLCNFIGVDGVSINELRYTGKGGESPRYADGHVKGYDFFRDLNVIECKTPEELITNGCVDDFIYRGLEFRLKRLCGYRLKSEQQTFKVVYSNGLKADDWILEDK